MEAVIQKYRGQSLTYGVLDCNLLVLELTDFDLSKIEPYSTLKGGAISIAKATQCNSPTDYIHSLGYKQISPLNAFDGDILIDGIHCGIYLNGSLFGIHKATSTFQFQSLTIEALQQMKVFSK
ncbi:C40 family peptidase [Enterovibrio calviensis]|uniref:hypothetical protein n=1 Tax=Enterovibrio calviensis TaxID=91359 RepID=UPI00047F6485|nr:hypothetical protein [Enterovibrio calviensis]